MAPLRDRAEVNLQTALRAATDLATQLGQLLTSGEQ
jgi:hypothetical protein